MSGKNNAAVNKGQSRRTVLYGGIFIVVVMLLILLSYFINVRNNRASRSDAPDSAQTLSLAVAPHSLHHSYYITDNHNKAGERNVRH